MSLSLSLSKCLKTTKVHLQKLEQMGIQTVKDLLEYFPRTLESTTSKSSFSGIVLDQKNTLFGRLCDFRMEKTARGKKLGRGSLVLEDGSVIESVWFRIPYNLKNFRDETEVFLVGKVLRNYGKIQISNPEVHFEKNVHIKDLRAIYTESPPITSKWLREKMSGVLTFKIDFSEFLPSEILQSEKLLNRAEAIEQIHNPLNLDSWNEAKRRLSFEEIFVIQTRVQREHILRKQNSRNNFKLSLNAEAVKKDITTLPFQLTDAQKKVLYQILKDFEKEVPAHRLVQGDVGSGKTVVAFLACSEILKNGFQATILAPTEILAEQHFRKAVEFFAKTSPEVKVEFLSGSVSAKRKKIIKQFLATGQINILIGTHAILTEDTVFKNLGLSIIDEQHRFGVEQRSILSRNNCHTVAMTATPIPRTLALTIYGNQDLSVINELPAGRKKIITRLVFDEKIKKKMEIFMESEIEKGHQIFWVCPLIDESDKIEAKNVMAEFERISQDFPNREVRFLHGKMNSTEKNLIMTGFREKEFEILVSTSVIEVGVDIPNATIMVIENAERFGLAQLHQFRGRIGRNDKQSYCFLMCDKKADKNRLRLQSMEKFHEGQKLAEIDLEIRGMGEIYGKKQSGLPNFRIADLTNVEMLENAKNWATEILHQNLSLDKFPKLREKIETEEVYF